MDEEAPREVGWSEFPGVHWSTFYRYYPRAPRGAADRVLFPHYTARDSACCQKQVVIGVTWPLTTLLKYVTLSGGL